MSGKTDAGTRQRMALMRMVQGGASKTQEEPNSRARRSRQQPEMDHKIRLAVEKRDVDQLEDLVPRVGCPNELRQKAWLLMCGVLPNATCTEFVKETLIENYNDYVQCASAMGLHSTTPSHTLLPFAQRISPLDSEKRKQAILDGNCFYCGSKDHYLRECFDNFNNTKKEHEGLVNVLLLWQYIRCHVVSRLEEPLANPLVVYNTNGAVRDGPLWCGGDDKVLLWLRAVCFRIAEAIQEPGLAFLVVRKVVLGFNQPWETRVGRLADTLVNTISSEPFPSEFEAPLRATISIVLGSMMVLTSHTTLLPNDVVLRIWDALIWQHDPLLCISRLVTELLQSKVEPLATWDATQASIHSLLSSFENWADEKQRLALMRACESG
eukprot:TRINITY_DN27497_c0_g1_i1.p1 TRINITY_DN27497_c0_g1~~TRINITY_DN27497_c0_g1_i1.p1  ORF type:complete len:391 (+),score=59.21 TRINITY_DN27497_c0_g1_i1:34-1173(+)